MNIKLEDVNLVSRRYTQWFFIVDDVDWMILQDNVEGTYTLKDCCHCDPDEDLWDDLDVIRTKLVEYVKKV